MKLPNILYNAMLAKKNKDKAYFDKYEVFGIWCPRRFRIAYKSLATMLGVPINVLVQEVLQDFLTQNALNIMEKTEFRQKLTVYLIEKYLQREFSD